MDDVKQEEGSDAEQEAERRDSTAGGSPQSLGYPAASLASPYMGHMTSAHFERIGYGVDPSVFRQSMSMYMSGCLPGLQNVGYPAIGMAAEHQAQEEPHVHRPDQRGAAAGEVVQPQHPPLPHHHPPVHGRAQPAAIPAQVPQARAQERPVLVQEQARQEQASPLGHVAA